MHTNDTDPFDFTSLASTDEQIQAETRKGGQDRKQKFTCIACAGSGLWQGGRANRHGNNKCNTCGGRGFVVTDPAKLRDRREAAARKKVQDRQSKIFAFKTEHPDMFKELSRAYDLREGNPFIISLADQFFTKHHLTENQIAAWYRGKAKLAAMQEQRENERRASAVEVDLSPIRSMFETAVGSGYKKPTYRAEGLVISRAPDSGNNPGALYIKSEDGVYMGKIQGTTFSPNREGKDAGTILKTIAEDPLAAALRYGQRTGRCACCGRELTNHASIDLGIGPVCREKWGL